MPSLCAVLPAVALAGVAVASAAGADCEGRRCRALALDGDPGSSVSLLQHRGRGAAGAPQEPELAPLDPESQRRRLERALPLAWVHVPKSGSSLGNFIVHIPGVCTDIPDDAIVSSEIWEKKQLTEFKNLYRVEEEDGACHGNIAHWGNHHGAGDAWDMYQSHSVIMVRQPEQRVMSGYSCNQHSWPELLPAFTPLQYAMRIQGCVVRMLTRGGTSPEETCGGRDGEPIKEEEVELAVERIRTGFAFVGITDQWALSMCLGHRIFGGKCRLSDFLDSRLTQLDDNGHKLVPETQVMPKAHLYNLSELHNFTDRYDGAVYEAAVEVFNEECKRYNVSFESCQPCFKEAGVEVEQ